MLFERGRWVKAFVAAVDGGIAQQRQTRHKP